MAECITPPIYQFALQFPVTAAAGSMIGSPLTAGSTMQPLQDHCYDGHHANLRSRIARVVEGRRHRLLYRVNYICRCWVTVLLRQCAYGRQRAAQPAW